MTQLQEGRLGRTEMHPRAIGMGGAWWQAHPASETIAAIERAVPGPASVQQLEEAYEAGTALQSLLADGRSRGSDLVDLLVAHSAQSSGCDEGITFDKKAARIHSTSC